MTNQVNQEFEKWYQSKIDEANENNDMDMRHEFHRNKERYKYGYQVATQSRESEINSLKQRVEELEAWKNEAIAVESEWDCQSVGKALNIQFGHSIRANILPKITALQADNLRLREALTQLTALKFSTASHIQKLDAVAKIANKALSSTPTQSLAEHELIKSQRDKLLASLKLALIEMLALPSSLGLEITHTIDMELLIKEVEESK